MDFISEVIRRKNIERQLQIGASFSTFEKGKVAQEGEVREWSGKKFKKQGGKWIEVVGGKSKKRAEDPTPKGKKKEETSNSQTKQPSSPQISKFERSQLFQIKRLAENNPQKAYEIAASLSEEAQKVIPQKVWNDISSHNSDNTSPSNEENQKEPATNSELIESDKKEKIKAWIDKHKNMFDTGEHLNEDRSKAAKFLRAKSKGFIKGLKHEIEHIKESGSALKKIFTGKGRTVTDHEKKALKKVGISLGMTAATMLATGGLSAFAHGFAATAGHLGLHFIEHGLIETAGLSLIFAKAEKNELTDDDMDVYLKELTEQFTDWFEKGDWKDLLNQEDFQ